MYAKLSSLYQENPQQGRIMLLMVAIFLVIYFLPRKIATRSRVASCC